MKRKAQGKGQIQGGNKAKVSKVMANASQVAAPPAVSDFRQFVNNHVVGKVIKKGKVNEKVTGKNSVAPATIKGWQEPEQPPEGAIQNEIAKKFNSIPGVISKTIYKAGGPNSSSYYWRENGQNYLSLVPRNHLKGGPNPSVVAHELVHAIDHQARSPADRLNPKVWRHLGDLVTTGGARAGGAMKNFGEFGASVGKIQDKINPPGEFRRVYPIDKAYIEKGMDDAAASGGQANYQTPVAARRQPNWQQLFQDINGVVTHPGAAAAGAIPPMQNEGFFLNRASEFPAFMSERLTEPWGAKVAPGALSIPEARFVHRTLRDMGAAYPAADYPIMNSNIMARRGSLEQAYYPPAQGGVPAAGFSQGGGVKRSKPKKYGLSAFLSELYSTPKCT